MKDQSLTDTDALPRPDVIAAAIADELEAAFDLFSKIAQKLPGSQNESLSIATASRSRSRRTLPIIMRSRWCS